MPLSNGMNVIGSTRQLNLLKKGKFKMIMTSGMKEEGISEKEMEDIYTWGKELEKKLKEKGIL